MPRRSRNDMFAQLVAVYESFRKDAVMENTDDGPRLLWRGYVVKLFESHGLKGPSYVRVRDELIRLEAIMPSFQGTGQQKSVFYVNPEPPTREAWDSIRDLGQYSLRGLTRLKGAVQIAELGSKVRQLENALAGLAADYAHHKEKCPHE